MNITDTENHMLYGYLPGRDLYLCWQSLENRAPYLSNTILLEKLKCMLWVVLIERSYWHFT